MSTRRIETLIWLLIYGGLIVAALGLSVRASDPTLGWGLVIGGAIVAVIGVVLIVVRSRMKAP
jgi:hypothetical protein